MIAVQLHNLKNKYVFFNPKTCTTLPILPVWTFGHVLELSYMKGANEMKNRRKHNEICMLNDLNILINYHDQQITIGNSFLLHTHSHQQSLLLRLDRLVCITAKHDLSRNLPRAQILDPWIQHMLFLWISLSCYMWSILHPEPATSTHYMLQKINITTYNAFCGVCTTFCMIVQCQGKCKSGPCLRNMSGHTFIVKTPIFSN
jgi:hypothetical protein